MTKMIYNFSVPIKGEENFSVVAENYEEAVEKVYNGDYYIEPTIDDADWDFDYAEADEVLPKMYTLEKYEGDE